MDYGEGDCYTYGGRMIGVLTRRLLKYVGETRIIGFTGYSKDFEMGDWVLSIFHVMLTSRYQRLYFTEIIFEDSG